ncbi:unnamed protein product [Pedinophyceae sp. YPF-701]|nr:unnamed protein product [Pedinophyceae sp. YPF-701]
MSPQVDIWAPSAGGLGRIHRQQAPARAQSTPCVASLRRTAASAHQRGSLAARSHHIAQCQLRRAVARAARDDGPELASLGDGKTYHRADLQVVLVHPQIPQNAGNVARTCAATSVALHLVGPLGFDLSDKNLKRAGLDYWPYVAVAVWEDWDAFYRHWTELPEEPRRLIAFTKFARHPHCAPAFRYEKGDWLLFGAETSGLPEAAHEAARQHGAEVRIPMVERHVRSINLAVSVGVGLYEAVRQLDEQAGIVTDAYTLPEGPEATIAARAQPAAAASGDA